MLLNFSKSGNLGLVGEQYPIQDQLKDQPKTHQSDLLRDHYENFGMSSFQVDHVMIFIDHLNR